jgi:hypothetical protein
MKKIIIIPILILLVSLTMNLQGEQEIDARSSATTQAVQQSFPDNLSLKIFGKVKKIYQLKSDYLATLSRVRIRTREVTPEGDIMGAYIYHGIPLYFLLDGIVPLKGPKDVFDRPLDLIVSFISKTGRKSHFSYGELTMCDDNGPVMLAFYREPLLPAKGAENYQLNIYKKPLSGLRLVCPQDKYDNRYLDGVVSIKFSVPKTSDSPLPGLSKEEKCKSKKLFCISDGKKFESSFQAVPVLRFENWFRIGHGRGIKSKDFETVRGFSLRSFLKNNFGPGKVNDFYLFVGCDGYRSIFSWSEIFQTSKGEKMIIITDRNGTSVKNDIILGSIADFFVDRNIRGLTCIEKV